MLNYYLNTYKGQLSEKEFQKLLGKANMIIKKYTFNRVDEESTLSEVKNCICEIVDYLYIVEKNEGKTSEKVGNWSITYKNSDNAEINSKIKNILSIYLGNVYVDGVNVLYRGL